MADEVVETLKLIWGEMKALNSRVDRTNDKLEEMRADLTRKIDQTNSEVHDLQVRLTSRIDSLEDKMSRALVETQRRVASEVVAVAGLVRDVRDRLDDVEQRVSALERGTH